MVRRMIAAALMAALLICASATGLAAEAAEQPADEADSSARITINIDNTNINTNVNGVPWGGPIPLRPGQPWYPEAPWFTFGPMTAGHLVSGLYAPNDILYVVNVIGDPVPYDQPIATGDSVLWIDASGNDRQTEMVVKGDVLGTGILSIAQLVRLAKALNGSWPLYGPYFLAGDLNSSGRIDIADLVAEAELLW